MHTLFKHYTPWIILLICLWGPQLQAQKFLRQAEKQFELGEFAAAAEGLEKFLRKEPGATEEKGQYAYALRMLLRLDEALALYKELKPLQNPEYSYQHALVLMELGRYAEAVEQLSEAARLGHPMATPTASRLQYAQAHRNDPVAWKISNEFANHSSDDYAPETFGDYVIFASERDGSPAHLMRTTRDDNAFLRVPSKLHRTLTEQRADAPVTYSPSGQLVAYTKNNFQSGERFLPEAGWELSLMLSTTSEQQDFGPGKPFAHNGNGFNTGFASFSEDGKRLYFSSDRPGGEGGYDLYYSERTETGWSNPVNLGPGINTPGNEIAPQATSGSLYFSSDYLPGFGGMDIFRADLLGSSVTTVVNLGFGVNSPLDDMGFALSADGQYAYLYSNRAGGKGGLDIYRAVRNGMSLTIAVIDGKTGQPVPNAILNFSDCKQGNFLTGIDGKYTFRAMPTMNCTPTVRKSGYNLKQFSINAAGLRENQRLEIVLNPEDKVTVYEGIVVHSRTGDPIANASITADQLNGDVKAAARSDAKGHYQLSLEREARYRISYEAEGMESIDREVNTAETEGPNVLSTFAMFPAQVLAPPAESLAVTSQRVGLSDKEAKTTAADKGGKTGVAKPKDTSGRGVDFDVPAGFSVQVAALSEKINDISEYETRLAELGPVYGKRENGLLRIRVGPFANREDAIKAQSQIKAKGFADAFIASEAGGRAIGHGSASSFPGSAIPAAASTATEAIFYVRLGAFSSPDKVNLGDLPELAEIRELKSGTFTVLLLGAFTNSATAQKAQVQAKNQGFEDAYIVLEDQEGRLNKWP